MMVDETKDAEVMGTIKSSLPHPVTIAYGDEGMRLSPHSIVRNAMKSKIGLLPNKVIFIQDK